jgi:colanic acid biosynthesis glycosyl transferase WcaI
MNILFLTNYWPPEIGAASHLYFELSKALVTRGHRVTVLTGFPRYNVTEVPPQYRGKLAMWEDQQGVRVRRVKTFHLPQHVPLARGVDHFLLAAVYGLAGLGLERPDVLLMYSPPLPMGLAACLIRTWKRCPLVLNVQDIFPQSAIDLGVLTQPLLIRFFEGLEKRLYRRADRITVHSAGNRENVLAKLRSVSGGRQVEHKVSVVHNWIDTDFVQPGPRNNAFRRALGLGEEFVVSFAGTMGYSQDIDTVLGAAAVLRDVPGILFLLVGDGVEVPRLKERAAQLQLPNVRWVPMQPRERYPSVLHASDASLVTLRADVGTPVVPSKLLSIMAAGRPALVSVPLEGDAPPIVREANCGFCVPPESPYDLAAAVLRLHQDRALSERLGHNGRAYIERHFSVAAAAAQYESLFQSLLDKRLSLASNTSRLV